MSLKGILRQAISVRPLIPSQTRLVFIYHDVSDPDSPHFSPLYSTPVDTFHRQMSLLRELFTLVSLEVLLGDASPDTPGRLAAITFDDGFRSVLQNAAPSLWKNSIPFTLFLNGEAVRTDHLSYAAPTPLRHRSAERVFLNEVEVRSLVTNGAGLGSHSWSHGVLSTCDEARLKDEIYSNKRYLEQLVSRPVMDFAIPYGKREHYSDDVIRVCKEAGHDKVYTSNPSWVEDLSGPLVPRVGLTNQTDRELLFLINRPRFRSVDI